MDGWLHPNTKFLDALDASTLLNMTLSVSIIDTFVNCAQGCLTDGSNPCSIFGEPLVSFLYYQMPVTLAKESVYYSPCLSLDALSVLFKEEY